MPSSTDGMTPTITNNLPDLSSILEQIDFDKKPIAHGQQRSSTFHIGKWGSLVIELLAFPHEEAAILEQYGLTKYQYETLRANPVFAAMAKDTEETVYAMAKDGGFQLSARRVAEQALSRLEEIIATGDDKDSIKAAEVAVRLANLDPAVQARLKQEQAAVNTGVQLVVNFGNGINPPKAFQGQSNTVIDVKENEIEDVE